MTEPGWGQAVDWPAYRLRGDLAPFDLACLVHRLNPEDVSNDGWNELQRCTGRVLPASPVDLAALLFADPERYFIQPVGSTLARLKLALGARFRERLTLQDAARVCEALGLSWPAELGAAASGKDQESAAERRSRRLSRFRALGGEMCSHGKGWRCAGKRGALADLVREEAAAGRRMAYMPDVRADLIQAMEGQMKG